MRDGQGDGQEEREIQHLLTSNVLKTDKGHAIERLAGILVDAEAPSDKARRKLAGATDQKSAIKELAKLGIPVKTLQGWLSMADFDDVVAQVKAKGVDASEAGRVAGLICP